MKAEKYEEIAGLQNFKTNWTLWEMYRAPDNQKLSEAEYSALLHKVVTINDFKQFCEVWSFLPHGTPSKVFYDKEQQEIKKFKIMTKDREEFRQIDTLCLFRENIKPSWEDPRNENGGTHFYTFTGVLPSRLDSLWLEICASLLTEEGINQSKHINGIRLCDKFRPPRAMEGTFKLELWIDQHYNSGEIYNYHKAIEDDIKEIINSLNIECQGNLYSAHQVKKK